MPDVPEIRRPDPEVTVTEAILITTTRSLNVLSVDTQTLLFSF